MMAFSFSFEIVFPRFLIVEIYKVNSREKFSVLK